MSKIGEEAVARFNDAELVAFGVGEHHVACLRTLANVDIPGAEFERPRHGPALILERRARQIEMHLVRAGLLLSSWKHSDPEPSVLTWQEFYGIVDVVH